MPRFNPEPVHLKLVADKVSIGQGFLQVLRSFPASITAPIVNTQPFYRRRYIILPTDSIIKQHTARYSIPTVGIWNKYSLTSNFPSQPHDNMCWVSCRVCCNNASMLLNRVTRHTITKSLLLLCGSNGNSHAEIASTHTHTHTKFQEMAITWNGWLPGYKMIQTQLLLKRLPPTCMGFAWVFPTAGLINKSSYVTQFW